MSLDKNNIRFLPDFIEYKEGSDISFVKQKLIDTENSHLRMYCCLKGQGIPPHKHKGNPEVCILILEGEAHYKEAEKEEVFKEGSLFVVGRDERFSIMNKSDTPLRFLCFVSKHEHSGKAKLGTQYSPRGETIPFS